ncbi:hypothetical protein AB835_00280 [Candidatus Endobugula sertula]|uniref:Uncharacterized protein n=1 Tax=Candidatus Endobugula sertula TaxID=62101 RepID=A0A1D2QTS8_9GAMM|nr:hypothetical protein AB835_00280 [Candidatus Endobugula sertula]
MTPTGITELTEFPCASTIGIFKKAKLIGIMNINELKAITHANVSAVLCMENFLMDFNLAHSFFIVVFITVY